MKPSRLSFVALVLAILVACGGLPRSVRDDIALENDRLHEAERQLQHAQDTVRQDIAQAPDLFRDTTVPAEWNAKLGTAREELNNAENKNRELADLARRGREDARFRANELLRQERELRQAGLRDSQAVETGANKWIDFQRDLPSHLGEMDTTYKAIRAMDLTPVSGTVERAEKDWPAKKSDLDNRLASLREIPKAAETRWNATEAARKDASAGKATGAEVATLIQADDALSNDAKSLTAKSDELRGLCGQLYNSWDKILTDLDVSHFGNREYRERIKTVRTHFIDVPSHKTETSSDERWVDVSEPAYQSVENDLGMAIAHKDAGVYDSEAETTPEPAGFAYIAPVSQGSNQYGYWTHSGGQSFWTFLPQYLILRELLWNHDYRPVLMDEYNGYRTAQRMGRSYYGQTTPTAPPKYGTHGTFTQTHYAQSRYVQSGGFKGSAYASRNGASSRFEESPHGNAPGAGSSAGKRFGFGANPPSGRRFGSPGGFRSPGRGFGRRR